MIAAIGTDGMRMVVWGIGGSAATALADARQHDGWPAGLVTRPITIERANRIDAGDVDASDLVKE